MQYYLKKINSSSELLYLPFAMFITSFRFSNIKMIIRCKFHANITEVLLFYNFLFFLLWVFFTKTSHFCHRIPSKQPAGR
jgi:hypothetical protein